MDRQEQALIIKEFLQHKGWEKSQNLLEAWREGKKREQASFLRQCNPEAIAKAQFIQGEIDGSYILYALLDEHKKQLTSAEGENPAY